MITLLLLDRARGSYEEHLEVICQPFWPAARIAARNAVPVVNAAALTPDEITARTLAHDNCPMPITLLRIQEAINEMTQDLVPTGAL